MFKVEKRRNEQKVSLPLGYTLGLFLFRTFFPFPVPLLADTSRNTFLS